MEQNSYNHKELIVFGELLKKESSHIREISRETQLNHMSVKRAIDNLSNQNILDFRMEGKNKKYFLKNNFESRNLKMIYEIYKRIEVVKKYPLLRTIFEKINENKRINLAILFGSYAKNRAHSESDIDIYIVTENLKLKEEIERINSRINVKIGKFNEKDFLIKEIIENHIIIKGVEEYYGK